MINIVTVIGARPQIIKAAAVSRAIREHFSHDFNEIIIHTGQHYDENMSEVFFQELEIPKPNYNLNVGSDLHGKQTAKMISGLEEKLLNVKPDYIILYGDTNSTLAGSVVAAKLHIPIVHIEAGMRSFNKYMPEEINRIVCDHCSTLLFSPTYAGYQNLVKEGFMTDTKPPYNIDNPCICHCGDIMYDNSIFFSQKAEKTSDILGKLNSVENSFLLATIHRDNNTDNPERLKSIFKSLNKIAVDFNIPVILPLHPRTSKLLKKNLSQDIYNSVHSNSLFKIINPVSFLDMQMLEKKSKMIITDSGGVQKEAYFFKKPCIILRNETEWVEIVENKAAVLADADLNKIIDAFKYMSALPSEHFIKLPQIFGNGHAAEFICEQLLNNK